MYGGDAGSLINNSQWVVYREGSRFVVICSREKIHAAMSDIISGSGGKIPEPIIDDAVKCVENITVHSSFIIRNTQSVYEGWSVDSGIGFELMPGDMIATPLRDAANNTIGIVPMGICIVLNYVLWWFTTRKWWNEQCKQMG